MLYTGHRQRWPFGRPVRAFPTGPGGAPRDRDEHAMRIKAPTASAPGIVKGVK